MNKILTRDVAALADVTSKDESRYGLSFVKVTDAYAEATNGKVLARIYHEEGWRDWLEEYPVIAGAKPLLDDRPVYIPADTLKKAFQRLPKKTDLPILGMALVCRMERAGGDKPVIATTDLETQNMSLCSFDVGFPDTDRIMDTGDAVAVESVALTVPSMEVISGFLKKFSDGKATAKFMFYGEKKPVRIKCQNLDGKIAELLVMPEKQEE